MMLPIHFRYCACSGRSKPNRLYKDCIIWSSTMMPRCCIWYTKVGDPVAGRELDDQERNYRQHGEQHDHVEEAADYE